MGLNYLNLKKEAAEIKSTISVLDYFFSLEKAGILKFEGKIGKELFFGFVEQRTGSISVSESSNLWFDHSMGQGGDIIKAVQVFENKGFVDAIKSLKANTPIESKIARNHQVQESNYEILKEVPISHPALKEYISSRGLEPEEVAAFCKELHWKHNEKVYFGIGLKNDNDGWSVRSKVFKGNLLSSGITTKMIRDRVGAIKIFEGMFDFLSYLKLFPSDSFQAIVLNSTSHFSLKIMEAINLESSKNNWRVDLYLDIDEAGNQKTKMALENIPAACDKRNLFSGFGDLNEMVQKAHIQSRKR